MKQIQKKRFPENKVERKEREREPDASREHTLMKNVALGLCQGQLAGLGSPRRPRAELLLYRFHWGRYRGALWGVPEEKL